MANLPESLEALLSQGDAVAAPRRGDLLTGRVLAVDTEGLIVDLGKKRDGVVPRSDLQGLPPGEADLSPGDEVIVMVVDPEDREGNLVVSISQARASGDWLKAQRMLENETIMEAAPSDCNRGGLIVPFGRLRAFVPASHLTDLPRGLDEEGRLCYLRNMIGRRMPFRVIEVDPQRRRLVLSERKAIRQWRQEQKSRVMDDLREGMVRRGVVTSLREFGAFVDIGGADGLIHISELAWEHVEDPGQVLQIGQEVETVVMRLDRQACRIGLSLKRLQPMPFRLAAEVVRLGQELDGRILRICDDGPIVRLDCGAEGRLACQEVQTALTPGSKVRVRVAAIRPDQERLDLELVPQAGEPVELA
ncbi:MAG: S1 RNA-binding domain-containing protein [Chloroflexota bacterium]